MAIPSATIPFGFHGANEAPPGGDRIRWSREIVAHLEDSAIYRAYENAFQGTTGLPLALRSVGAFHSPLVDSKNANSFCRLMSTDNKSCAACLSLQQKVEEAAMKGPHTLECFAGLSESAVPIIVGGQVVAFLQTGQVFLRRPTTKRFRRSLRELDKLGATVDRVNLEAAYFSTRIISKLQYHSILRLLTLIAGHISSLSNQLMVQQSGAELPAVTQARAYIALHQTEVLSLRAVSAAVNMSIFYFCKSFRKATGLTFVAYLARLRVENVKRLLLNPHKRISEAAYEAGFQSLSQFNRVFHRIEGHPPKTFRLRRHLLTRDAAHAPALPSAA